MVVVARPVPGRRGEPRVRPLGDGAGGTGGPPRTPPGAGPKQRSAASGNVQLGTIGDVTPLQVFNVFGENVNVQDGCVIHTDRDVPCVLGDNVSVGHMVMLHGCTIGDGSLIGMGAIILNRAVIGKDCLIAAGALITEGKHIPDGSLVMGAPGKVVRPLAAPGLAHNAWIPGHPRQRAPTKPHEPSPPPPPFQPRLPRGPPDGAPFRVHTPGAASCGPRAPTG